MNLVWHDRAFDELSPAQLYGIIRLRERVFIVEQRCIYVDADGYDPQCRHLWAATPEQAIVAYLRILPAGVKYPEPSLGRIITAREVRNTGLGRELVNRGLAALAGQTIRIQAQAYLEGFYEGLGFRRMSPTYDEDGIAHIDMLKPAST